MPRLNKKAELFSHLTEVGLIRARAAGGGSGTLGANAAKGALVMQTVATPTNFDDQDLVIVGTAESMEIAQQVGVAGANTINIKNGLARAHAAGSTVVEGERTILGDMPDDGLSLVLADGEFNAIMAATQREPVGYLVGHIAQMAEFGILNLNPENLCAALGMAESAISGAGTPASPTKLDLHPDDFASATGDLAFYFRGIRKDGLNIEVQLWGVEVDPTALSQALQFARGQQMPTPFRVRPTAGVRWLSHT